jgi:hypothetical protein
LHRVRAEHTEAGAAPHRGGQAEEQGERDDARATSFGCVGVDTGRGARRAVRPRNKPAAAHLVRVRARLRMRVGIGAGLRMRVRVRARVRFRVRRITRVRARSS